MVAILEVKKEIPVKIFLCWSGERSRHVAKEFDKFLTDLNQELPGLKNNPFDPFRSVNIEKGLPWFQAVESELASAEAALVTITPENCESPWMHYEAGAIANGMRIEMSRKGKGNANVDTIKGRLFTYLFGMDARMLKGPLAAYQSTAATYDDTRALVRRLLTIAGVALPTDEQSQADIAWEKRFRRCWNDFIERLRPCRHQQLADVVAGFAHKFQRLTFEEPIAQCHRQAWTDRIKGCHEVFTDLQSCLEQVKQRCRPFEVELYQGLLTALDGYEMTMQAYLATDKNYELGKNGKLEMDANIEWACENRRHTVLDGVCTLLDPQAAPIFDESAAFARLETFAEKKIVIHRRSSAIRRLLEEQKAGSGAFDGALDTTKIAELDNAPPLPDKPALEKASQSDWDFDRVIYYLTHAESIRVQIPEAFASRLGICIGKELHKHLLHWLNEEVENIRAKQDLKQQTFQEYPGSPSNDPVADSAIPESRNGRAEKASRIPLYYALGVLDELVKGHEDKHDLIHHLGAEEVKGYKNTLSNILELEEGSKSRVRLRADSIRCKIQRMCEPGLRHPTAQIRKLRR